ncbi:MAG: integrase family protein [Gammaproteobacteria bacterium]|nr:integrase family protein [Gammaproteobacteria bacterium]
MRLRLTATQCAKARPGAKYKWDNDGNGLYLRVRATGGKTWIIRRKVAGKTTITTLGEYSNTLGLQEARERVGSRKAGAQTFADLADKYLAEVVEPKHRRPEIPRGYLDRVMPEVGKKQVRDITRADLVAVIQNYKKRGVRAADSLRSTLREMFAFGLELVWIDHNPLADVCRRVTGDEPVHRTRVLTDDELRLLWAEPSPSAAMLRFLLLTGLRISEAQKGHQDGDRWIVPAAISKNKKPHWVHLTAQAKAQLPLPATTPTNVQGWTRRWCERKEITPAFTPARLPTHRRDSGCRTTGSAPTRCSRSSWSACLTTPSKA